MPKFHITTLGCKVNQYESEAIDQFLRQSGWKRTKKNNADVCVVNTCTVTAKASMQSRQAIRQAIRNNPDARIIVTGCYAQTASDEIKAIPGISEIVGHGDKHRIPQAILNPDSTVQLYPCTPLENACEDTLFSEIPVTVCGTRTRPFLKIQDGCNAFCTYCIVPYARGRSRSMPVDTVLSHLRTLSAAGYHETVLTGIHVGFYGQDLTPQTSLLELLRRIEAEKAIGRLRLSSIEPRELSRDIVQLVASSDQFCNHFHIPLQSGDNGILERMHRPYNRELFRNLVHDIHDRLPNAAIGVDTLIGFPGESEAAFANTYALIEELPVTYLHVFPYSIRKGTPAATYPDQISPDTLKQRCRKMRNLGNAKRQAFYRKNIGRTADVLIEHKRDTATGMLKGVTSNYISVRLEGGDELKNKIVPVRLIKTDPSGNVFGTVKPC